MIEKILDQVEDAAKVMERYDYARIVSHNDPDGVTSAAILCHAFYRRRMRFHATLVSRLNEEILSKIGDDLVIFCDLAETERIKGLRCRDLIVLDHHKSSSPVGIFINPWTAGIDGSRYVSTSGIAYALANKLGRNRDLAGLAVVGAIGDKQELVGMNREIAEEGSMEGAIKITNGLRIYDAPVKDSLILSTEPFLDVSGDERGVEEMLGKIGVPCDKDVNSLTPDEVRRLSSAIHLKLMKASMDALDSVYGEKCILRRELIADAFSFSQILDAVSHLQKPGLAMSLCLRDRGCLDEAKQLYRKHQKMLISTLRRVKGEDLNHITYIRIDDREFTGPVATIFSRYVNPGKPVLVLSRRDDQTRVSARCERRMVEMGLDLAAVMSEASSKVGGSGGGHDIAAGASIPSHREADFLSLVDRMVGEWLG